MQSDLRKVYVCLAVTGHLHFWQNDRDLLRVCVCACVRACVRVCERMCVRACVCACVPACVRARASVLYMHIYLFYHYLLVNVLKQTADDRISLLRISKVAYCPLGKMCLLGLLWHYFTKNINPFTEMATSKITLRDRV